MTTAPLCNCGAVAALALQVKSVSGATVGPSFNVCANKQCASRRKTERSIGGLAAGGRTIDRSPLAGAAALPVTDLFAMHSTG